MLQNPKLMSQSARRMPGPQRGFSTPQYSGPIRVACNRVHFGSREHSRDREIPVHLHAGDPRWNSTLESEEQEHGNLRGVLEFLGSTLFARQTRMSSPNRGTEDFAEDSGAN
jgi:hypothetical protein